MKISKHIQLKGIIVVLILTIIPLLFGLIPSRHLKLDNSFESEQNTEANNLELGLPPTSYDWWNNTWTFRVPVSIEAVGSQQDAPVELFINFTNYFEDIDIQNPELNTSTIRVIEYLSSSNYYEVESQFDPYSRSYDSQTNAIGDLIWILNGTTPNGQIRDFFIYFENGTNFEIPEPNYETIRLWHEGFEEYQTGDIGRPTDGQDIQPTFWEISNSTSARGSSSLRIWGNCWKWSATGSMTVNPDMRVTAKMRFDDPSIQREISGIGFDNSPTNIPSTGNSYRIRGSQSWGTAGGNKFVNQYYTANTFFWYTFIPDIEFSLSPFTHIVYIADDDSWNSLDLYWDDISIWNKPVRTTPNNSIQTTMGDIQPIAYRLKVICKDEDGNRVPNAHLYLTNDIFPSYNQDHLTDENGEWTFDDLEKEVFYNITANYTQNGLTTPETATVFYYENFQITQLNNEITAYLTLAKYNFDIKDKENDPIQNGFVLLKDGVDTVGKATLSSSGTGDITWLNNTAYDYEVYFDYDSLTDNSKYRYSNILINKSAVPGNDIDITTEITQITFNVTDNTAEKVPFTNAKLRFYNQSDYSDQTQIIANVTVDINGLATFTSFSDTYGTWGDYTVDIYFGGSTQSFNQINPASGPHVGFDFTLRTENITYVEVIFENREWYNTTVNIINYDSTELWSNDVTINFNFTYQDPYTPTPTLVTPDELTIQIFDGELTAYSA
ncbi:MAG: hypothetical protein ACFE9S_20180, partial [Candidatus Hermodarchaeota archaeon]